MAPGGPADCPSTVSSHTPEFPVSPPARMTASPPPPPAYSPTSLGVTGLRVRFQFSPLRIFLRIPELSQKGLIPN